MKKIIYLDYAAASPMDETVVTSMKPYFASKFYNPSANYLAARSVLNDLETARREVAAWLGIRPSEIIFTSGGTEANNLAINGIMQNYPECNVVTSAIEHDSVLIPASQYTHKIVPVNQKGEIDLSKLEAAIDEKTVLVSVMYANNEIGTVQPLKQISEIIEKKRRLRNPKSLPLLFHTDACQAANYLDLHINRLGVQLMTLNGGKIYGPKQSGVLMVKAGIKLQPQILGGGQEQGLRSGTENVASCIGFAHALKLVQTRRGSESKRLQKLQEYFFTQLEKNIPESVVNGAKRNRLPNNVHVSFPGQDNERLMIELDEVGILCAAGSACSASSDQSSHVLKAIGLSDKEARSSLRLTMGIDTNEADIIRVVRSLTNLNKIEKKQLFK